jgi:hypothetical protein
MEEAVSTYLHVPNHSLTGYLDYQSMTIFERRSFGIFELLLVYNNPDSNSDFQDAPLLRRGNPSSENRKGSVLTVARSSRGSRVPLLGAYSERFVVNIVSLTCPCVPAACACEMSKLLLPPSSQSTKEIPQQVPTHPPPP